MQCISRYKMYQGIQYTILIKIKSTIIFWAWNVSHPNKIDNLIELKNSYSNSNLNYLLYVCQQAFKSRIRPNGTQHCNFIQKQQQLTHSMFFKDPLKTEYHQNERVTKDVCIYKTAPLFGPFIMKPVYLFRNSL